VLGYEMDLNLLCDWHMVAENTQRKMVTGLKLYNKQRNAQFFYLFPYLLLHYMFRAFFNPMFKRYCAPFQPDPDADTIPRRLEPLPNLYTVPLEDGLKESPKRLRQKQLRKSIKKTCALRWLLYNFISKRTVLTT
jgi:hypothetical protein